MEGGGYSSEARRGKVRGGGGGGTSLCCYPAVAAGKWARTLCDSSSQFCQVHGSTSASSRAGAKKRFLGPRTYIFVISTFH